MSAWVRWCIQRKWAGNRARDAVRLAEQPVPDGVEMLRGIPYLPGGHPMHTLNLYRPAGCRAPLPTVVDIHGGGWMYGDRELNRNYCAYLASRGYRVMGMSYRLLPETDLRGQLQDIFHSLAWLTREGERLGFDLSRVLLTGDSAGGHLAGLTACALADPALRTCYDLPQVSLTPTVLGICHGVCDIYDFSFLEGWKGRLVKREYRNMLLGRPWRRSPILGRASLEECARGVELPPVFVVSSEPDFYYGQSEKLLKFLEGTGRQYESLCWRRDQGEHLTHVFEVNHWDWPESRRTNDRMLEFFCRCCPTGN